MRILANQTHLYPIIMVHGGTRTGTTYTGTPDGRESWAQYFARRDYAVYVVDQPGRGRYGYVTETYGPQTLSDGESGSGAIFNRRSSNCKIECSMLALAHTCSCKCLIFRRYLEY
jgi:pimeloyl-ACP methyl ester carboxylesterase